MESYGNYFAVTDIIENKNGRASSSAAMKSLNSSSTQGSASMIRNHAIYYTTKLPLLSIHYDSSVKTTWSQTHWSHIFDYLAMTVVLIFCLRNFSGDEFPIAVLF